MEKGVENNFRNVLVHLMKEMFDDDPR